MQKMGTSYLLHLASTFIWMLPVSMVTLTDCRMAFPVFSALNIRYGQTLRLSF